jgi:hypothetical protein
MATQLQIRRGTTSQMNAFTGAEGELAVNTTTDTVHVHDGSTAGGHALAKADGSNIAAYAGSFTTIAASGTITGNVTGNLTGNVTGNVTGNITGSVLTAAQTNITSLGTLTALTVSGAFTSLGIDDNANATAITLNADESSTFAGPIILTAGALAAAGNAGLSHRSADNKVYLQAGTGGFNILDDQQNTHFSIDSAGVSSFYNNVGISTSNPKSTLEVKGTFGAPATSGSAAGFISRFSQSSGVGCLDVGFGDPYSWIQSRASNNYATNFYLVLQPNGGNVGIGNSAPAATLHVDPVANVTTGFGTPLIKVGGDESWAGNGSLYSVGFGYVDSSVANKSPAEIGFVTTSSAGHTKGDLVFATRNVTSTTAPLERMRIGSDGSLSVGGVFSGGLTDTGFFVAGNNKHAVYSVNSSTSSSTYHVYDTGGDAYKFYVNYTGNIHAVNTTISQISDVRWKENIRDLDDGLSKVMQLQPRKFDWKEGKGKDVTNDRGFIAQEFETVFPDLIDEWIDPAPEGEEPYKSVRADLIPTLVKAIQEQQATIESQAAAITDLTTRLTALENQ